MSLPEDHTVSAPSTAEDRVIIHIDMDAFFAAVEDVTLDGTIATSGDYYNFRKLGDKKITHHIDPQSGYPLEYYRVSVSVLAPTAMMADAWATALSVLGRDRAYILASELGLAVYLVSVKNDTVEKAKINARWTPAFSDHL